MEAVSVRCLHPGLYLDVQSSLKYEYSVIQSLTGDYHYVQCWDGGPVSQAKAGKSDESVKAWTGS